MQSDFEHQEVSRDYPEPLEASGALWALGMRALPAVSLSMAALSAFLIVLLVLLADPRWRSIFELPFEPGLVAWPTAGFALIILLITRLRPGRSFPRYVIFALTLLGFVLALTSSLLRPAPSTLHILIVAELASILSLSPRMIKLRPESPWVQRIAILSLAAVLLLVLPAAFFLGDRVEDRQRARVAEKIGELSRLADELRELTQDFDWSRFQNDPRQASANAERLAEMNFRRAIPDDEILRVAGVFGLVDELSAAACELIDGVTEALEPASLPRTSTLSEPAIYWDPNARRWIESSLFPVMSDLVGRYHSEVGRLFTELEPTAPEPDQPSPNLALARIREHHQNASRVVHDHLETELNSFADHWAISRNANFTTPPPHLVDLLKMPLFRADGRHLTIAGLSALLGLPVSRARDLAESSPGCFRREYPDNFSYYFRVDCYAYGPAGSRPGAEMRVEFRLVYVADQYSSHQFRLAEAYLIFPIPSGSEMATFRLEVMDALAKAAREIGGGSVYSQDRGGSVASGFLYLDSSTRIRVFPLNETWFTDRQQALQVRLTR